MHTLTDPHGWTWHIHEPRPDGLTIAVLAPVSVFEATGVQDVASNLMACDGAPLTLDQVEQQVRNLVCRRNAVMADGRDPWSLA